MDVTKMTTPKSGDRFTDMYQVPSELGLGSGLGLGSMSSVSTCMVPPSFGERMSQRAFPSRREVKPTLKELSAFCTWLGLGLGLGLG